MSRPFFSGGSVNGVESGPFSGRNGADLTGVLSMGSFMPLPVVSSAEHLVTDTAAVGL
jgi:hypothetical protein